VTGVDIWSTARSVRQRAGRHAAQRVGLKVWATSTDRDRRHARASVSGCQLRSDGLPAFAIHNISSNADRRRAIAEGFRVLNREAGWDRGHRATAIYEEALRGARALDVERRRPGVRFWWGNPFAGTTLLTASKALV